MNRLLTRLLLTLFLVGLLMPSNGVEARSLGELLKALGNSIAHPQKHPRPRRTERPKDKKAFAAKDAPAAPPSGGTSTPIQPTVRVASAAPQAKGAKRDVPYAIPVPKNPGFVTSPYAPNEGWVDVRGFPSGSEVKDPFSGKIFLAP